MNNTFPRKEKFNFYETGSIIAGLRWFIHSEYGLEKHECYQYRTYENLIEAFDIMCAGKDIAAVQVLKHTGGYKNLKTLYTKNVNCEFAEGKHLYFRAERKVYKITDSGKMQTLTYPIDFNNYYESLKEFIPNLERCK